LGAKNFQSTDESIAEQFVDLILDGLKQAPETGRIAKGKT
jgi:hypothetical protein